MPMNPRLLRPTQGGFVSPDADARAYLAAVRIADGSNLEPAVAKAISDFIIGCKGDGIWDAIKASCILAGARTLAGALVPLKGTAPTNNNFAEADYNRETGLVGDGSTTYLDSGRDGDDDPQNDQHAAVYVSTAHSQAGAGAYIASGLVTGTGGATDIGRSGLNTANLFVRSQAQTAGAVNGAGAATGFIGVTRAAAGSFTARASGSDSTISVSSQAPTSNDVDVFRFSGGSGPTNGRLAFYSIGESLDLEALDTRVSALITAIGNAI